MENQPPAARNPTPQPDAGPASSRLAQWRNRLSSLPHHNLILYGVIAVLVTAGLLLPPISLLDRVFVPCGAQSVAIGTGAPSVQHPDGLSVLQVSADQSYRLTLSTISLADFDALRGAVDEALADARAALPVNLVPASPIYRIAVCGDEPQPGALRVSIPAGAKPVNTLDLYAWNAEAKTWSWIGSNRDAAGATVSASVDALPPAVALMQTTSTAPTIGVEVDPGESLAADWSGVVTELYPTGLVIAADGLLGGDRTALLDSASSQAIYPVIRNYLTRGQSNPDLVRGVLSMAETRQAHIAALAALATHGPVAGVTLDYQGLDASDLDAYTAFVIDLAAALHGRDKRLNVVLPPPTVSSNGETDTAGYDWYRIGLAADGVQSPLSDAALIDWATSQVNRYKFQPILSVGSAEAVNAVTTPISFKQAVESLGVVSATGSHSVTARSVVTFTLQARSAIDHFEFDSEAGAYRYEYTDKSGAKHTVTLRTAAALASDVATALPYYVRGVVIRGVAGGAPSVVDVLRAYRQQTAAKVTPEIAITWQVNSGNRAVATIDRPLTESWFGWQAPAQSGTYRVSASISGLERGAIEVAVGARPAAPEEEVRAVTAGVGSGDGDLGSDATPGGAPAGDCYNTAYVADVTVPDGTRLDNDKEFTKTWKVRNNGVCAWSADTEIAFVQGSQLGAPSTVQVGTLEVGQEIEISVPMKTSDQDGAFTGVWQLRNADGFYGHTLTVVIQAGEAVVAAAPAVPAPPVVGPIGNIGSFEAGGHIDGFSRPDLMRYSGLKWIKIQTYAGVDVSGAIANAHAQGFKILLGIIGDKERVMDPAYQGEYADAVAAMAAAGADAIEVWNEPNIDREWPTGQVSGANYTALLARVYPTIKAANPGTLVISGAPAPTGFWGAAGCSANGCNDDAFIAQMAAAGAASYLDCVGAHHNAGATAPSASSGHPAGSHYSWYFFPTLNLYYNAFGGARKVCFTELGYLTDDGMPTTLQESAPAFAWAGNVSLAQQAAWLAEAAALSARSGKVRLMIIWNVDFTRYDSDPMAGYAMIRPDGSCPACESLRAVLGGR